MESFIKPWLPGPAKSYIFINANIIDTLTGSVRSESTLLISGGYISSVLSGPRKSFNAGDPMTGNDTQVVDLAGKYIIPGLIDSHVHIAMTPGDADPKVMVDTDEHLALLRMSHSCRSFLSRGFTTVRDCGGAPMSLRAATADWLILGPRLVLAGHALTQTGGHGDFRSSHKHQPSECPSCGHVTGMTRLCDGVDDCLRKTRDELRRGSDFIKIMGSGGMLKGAAGGSSLVEREQFTVEDVRAISSVANSAGSYVTAHAYTPVAIMHAIENGVKGIEHGNFLDEETATEMAARDVFLTPTLAAFATALDGTMSKGPGLPEPVRQKFQKALDAGYEAMRIAKRAGVAMCFGTDLLGPPQAFQSCEFGLRSKVCSPLEILQQATVNPARMLGLENKIG